MAYFKFNEIDTPEKLIAYLSDSSNRLRNKDDGVTHYIYHYTKIENALSIIKNRFWYLSSPDRMNDGLEFKNNFDAFPSKSVFFASFMYDLSESIAMWAMYAQPWEEGVLIRIPVEKFKTIKKGRIYKISGNMVLKKENALDPRKKVSLVRVAYTNTDSFRDQEEEIVTCGERNINRILKNTAHSFELIGYIKDMAWAYEREVRVLVSMDEKIDGRGLAVELPEDFINSMEIIAGPRFAGNLSERINLELKCQIKTEKSLFSRKLKWISCDSCRKKR